MKFIHRNNYVTRADISSRPIISIGIIYEIRRTSSTRTARESTLSSRGEASKSSPLRSQFRSAPFRSASAATRPRRDGPLALGVTFPIYPIASSTSQSIYGRRGKRARRPEFHFAEVHSVSSGSRRALSPRLSANLKDVRHLDGSRAFVPRRTVKVDLRKCITVAPVRAYDGNVTILYRHYGLPLVTAAISTESSLYAIYARGDRLGDQLLPFAHFATVRNILPVSADFFAALLASHSSPRCYSVISDGCKREIRLQELRGNDTDVFLTLSTRTDVNHVCYLSILINHFVQLAYIHAGIISLNWNCNSNMKIIFDLRCVVFSR